PISASQGLIKHPGSVSMGRAPSLSSRVKHSCRLLKRACFASLRSRSENTRHSAIQAAHTRGCSMRLSRPTACPSQRRGMRLVSRKLMSSWPTTRAIRERVVILVSLTCNRVRRGARRGRAAAKTAASPSAVARQTPLVGGTFTPGAQGGLLGAALRVRRSRFFPRGRGARGGGGAAAAGVHATLRHPCRALQEKRSADRRGGTGTLGPAVHFPLPRALPIQRPGTAALQAGRRRRDFVRRVHRRYGRQPAVRPD